MPQIIPIRDLKDTSAVSQMCHAATEPIYITKNGYGDMVIMSVEMYEERMFMQDVYNKIEAARESVRRGEVMDAFESLRRIRDKYEL